MCVCESVCVCVCVCCVVIGVSCVCVCEQEEVRQTVASAEPVQYYFTLAQQPGTVQVQGQQQGQQATGQTATTLQPGQIIIAQPQQGQVTHARAQTHTRLASARTGNTRTHTHSDCTRTR